jgi:hypothetical protein
MGGHQTGDKAEGRQSRGQGECAMDATPKSGTGEGDLHVRLMAAGRDVEKR